MGTYFKSTSDCMFKRVKQHEENERTYSITSNEKKYLSEINTEDISENSSSAEKATQTKTQGITKNINELKNIKEGWKDKPLHGK